MYIPRSIQSQADWLDTDGIKIYTISTQTDELNWEPFIAQLEHAKSQQPRNWKNTASFCIFHQGLHYLYLVLVWWANDNELFTSVSINKGQRWLHQPPDYSFCLYDLEVFWWERNIYIDTIDRANPDIHRYRQLRGC